MPHNSKHTRKGKASTADIAFLLIIVASVGVVIFLRNGGMSGGAEHANTASAAVFEHTSTFAEASAEAKTQDRPIFVLATADWCPPCRTLKSTTLADAEVQQRLADSVVAYKLDITDENDISPEDMSLVQSLGVRGIPALYILDQQGNLKAKTVGSMGKASFMSWLDTAID